MVKFKIDFSSELRETRERSQCVFERKGSAGVATLSAHKLHLRLAAEVQWLDSGFIVLKRTTHSVA